MSGRWAPLTAGIDERSGTVGSDAPNPAACGWLSGKKNTPPSQQNEESKIPSVKKGGNVQRHAQRRNGPRKLEYDNCVY